MIYVAADCLPAAAIHHYGDLQSDRLSSRSCGRAATIMKKSMVITAHGFAMPVKQAFAPVLKLRKWLNPVSLVPGWQCEGSALLFRRMALVELAVLVW